MDDEQGAPTGRSIEIGSGKAKLIGIGIEGDLCVQHQEVCRAPVEGIVEPFDPSSCRGYEIATQSLPSVIEVMIAGGDDHGQAGQHRRTLAKKGVPGALLVCMENDVPCVKQEFEILLPDHREEPPMHQVLFEPPGPGVAVDPKAQRAVAVSISRRTGRGKPGFLGPEGRIAGRVEHPRAVSVFSPRVQIL